VSEIIDTSSKYPDKEIPDGTYTFEVGVATKKDISGKTGYEWNLEYDGKTVQVLMWPNQMGPLLRLLGVKEQEPNKFVFDSMAVEGKEFKATAYKTQSKGKTYQNLKDFAAVETKDEGLPF